MIVLIYIPCLKVIIYLFLFVLIDEGIKKKDIDLDDKFLKELKLL